jgi:predicted ATPase with chaperone activity
VSSLNGSTTYEYPYHRSHCQLHLSARAYHRVLKLARTIADLACAADIGPAHLAFGDELARQPAPSGTQC